MDDNKEQDNNIIPVISEEELTQYFEHFLDWFSEAMNQLAEAFNNWLESITPDLEAFNQAMRDINFYRRDDESFPEWADRLAKEGYLDDSEYRWLYQKAAYRWLASPLIWLWKKVS